MEKTKDESCRLRTAVVNMAGEGDNKVLLGKAVNMKVWWRDGLLQNKNKNLVK